MSAAEATRDDDEEEDENPSDWPGAGTGKIITNHANDTGSRPCLDPNANAKLEIEVEVEAEAGEKQANLREELIWEKLWRVRALW